MSHSPAETIHPRPGKDYARGFAALRKLIVQGRSFSSFERDKCFLNTGDGKFADASAVSGFEFADDGRGLALIDWDFDGRLDVWMTNRIGPNVRFLHNVAPTDAHYVAFLPEGRSCNRDAIGARLELFVGEAGKTKRIATTRAGEGFCSQSSRWVHFGLGKETKIEKLVVHWPGGKAETFTGLSADARFNIVQGSGAAVRRHPPGNPTELTPSVQKPAASTEIARIVRVEGRVPLPDIEYIAAGDIKAKVSDHVGRGWLVLNLWASWCGPCKTELAELTAAAEKLRAAPVEVLALSVDGLGGQPEGSPAEADALIRKLGFPFPAGRATEAGVTALDALQRANLALQRPMPIPTTFLIDPAGLVAATYRGPVSAEVLILDAKRLAKPETLREHAVPFAGTWFAPPPKPDAMAPAEQMLEAGLLEAADSYYKTVLPYYAGTTKLTELPESAGPPARRIAAVAMLWAAIAAAWFGARLLGMRSPAVAAVAGLILAVPGVPATIAWTRPQGTGVRILIEDTSRGAAPDIEIPRAASYQHLKGVVLADSGNDEAAVAAFREAVRLYPAFGRARADLGGALARKGEHEEAVEQFTAALAGSPADPDLLHDRGLSRLKLGRRGPAAADFLVALKLRPDFPEAKANLAKAKGTE